MTPLKSKPGQTALSLQPTRPPRGRQVMAQVRHRVLLARHFQLFVIARRVITASQRFLVDLFGAHSAWSLQKSRAPALPSLAAFGSAPPLSGRRPRNHNSLSSPPPSRIELEPFSSVLTTPAQADFEAPPPPWLVN